jgi:hypothetical protein
MLKPIEIRMRYFPEGDTPGSSLRRDPLSVIPIADKALNDLGGGHVRAAFIKDAVRHPAATRPPLSDVRSKISHAGPMRRLICRPP